MLKQCSISLSDIRTFSNEGTPKMNERSQRKTLRTPILLLTFLFFIKTFFFQNLSFKTRGVAYLQGRLICGSLRYYITRSFNPFVSYTCQVENENSFFFFQILVKLTVLYKHVRKFCSVAVISMVTLMDFIHRIKS